MIGEPPHRQVLDPYTCRLIQRTAQALARSLGGAAEDYAQELKLHVFAKREHYDSARGRWTTFVKQVIYHQAISLWRTAQVSLNLPRLTSLNQAFVEEETELQEILDQERRHAHTQLQRKSSQTRFELNHDVENLTSRLTSSDQEICRLLTKHTVSEAARQLNVPRSTLSDRITKIRERFEDEGLRDYL